MRRIVTVLISTASLALAGTAGAENAKPAGKPTFRSLDANKDGFISPAEAAASPPLARDFKHFDRNHDGKLNRAEYVGSVIRSDTTGIKKKVTQ